ncbi:MAG: TolB family protein [Anaerovoracaceae bacterium]
MKKKFMPEDMERIRYLSYPAVTADGSLIAWVETTGNSEDGSFRPNILVWDSRTKEIRRLTDEGGQEKQPVFYRNGKVLVYLARVEGVYQIFSRDLVSGTVRQLTTLRHGVIRFSLSEKNGKIAFEALLWPEDVEREQAFCQMDAGQRQAWEKELDMRPYFITDLTYKWTNGTACERERFPISVRSIWMAAVRPSSIREE